MRKRTCRGCGKPISRKNKSGRCKKCLIESFYMPTPPQLEERRLMILRGKMDEAGIPADWPAPEYDVAMGTDNA